MTKTIDLEVLPAPAALDSPAIDLAVRRDRILTLHAGCRRSAVNYALYRLLCGIELNAVKEQLPHGQFMKWREEHLPDIGRSAAQNYMALATIAQTKLPTVGNLAAQPLLLTNGEIPADREAELLSIIRTSTESGSLTELFREFGILKAPQRQQYTPPQDRSPAEILAAEKAAALDHVDSLLSDLSFLTPETLALVPDTARKQLLDSLIDKSNLLRSLRRGKAARTGAGHATSDLASAGSAGSGNAKTRKSKGRKP